MFVFHEVTDTPSEFLCRSQGYVSTEIFRKQIAWIGERFHFIPPTALPQLGSAADLPIRAALVTFDDAWAGVFRIGLPMLGSLGVPALCFLNMATVHGTPDLSAVRRYERLHPPAHGPRLDRILSADQADAVLGEVVEGYRDDPEYTRFQGPTATCDDLNAALGCGTTVWFGSHLFHHWDTHRISRDLFKQSVRANASALSHYGNALPVLATPYGRELDRQTMPHSEFGIPLVFTATGGQNGNPGAPILDRLALQPEPSGPRDWWYSTYRRRLFRMLSS